MGESKIRALTSQTWDAFADLCARHNGAGMGGCWCTWFHNSTMAERRASWPARDYKQRLVRAGGAHAALVFDGDTAVGCKYGTPEELPGISHRKEVESAGAPLPVGFRYSADDVLGSGGSPVFVDEAAEDWSPDDACGSVVSGVLGSRWVQLLAAVGPLRVVVADVFAEEQSKMSLAEDQYPVGEFGSDSSYESFGEAVRLWTSGWDLHDADTGVGEDGVEGTRELAGSIPYE